jgi:hypothetical protein
MSKEQKAESCPEFVTQDQMIEAEKLINDLNKSYIQQSTNPELQIQDRAQQFNAFEQRW